MEVVFKVHRALYWNSSVKKTTRAIILVNSHIDVFAIIRVRSTMPEVDGLVLASERDSGLFVIKLLGDQRKIT